MSAFSVSTVESALRYWLTTSTGLGETAVIWSDQAGQEPAKFITLELSSLSEVGWDETRYTAAADPQPLAEVQRHRGGPRELQVHVQAQSRSLFGTDGAFELARKAQLGLGLEQVRTRLSGAGLAVIDPGKPMRIRTLLDTRFVSRYALDPRFHASDESVEALATIAEVHGAGHFKKEDGTSFTTTFTAAVTED